MITAHEFVSELGRGLQTDHERLVANAFLGDPQAVVKQRWRSRGVIPNGSIPGSPAHNRYISVAAFKRADDGTWRRKKELFTAGCAFMVDDLNTKVPWAALGELEPTAIIETSKGNFQAWYFFDEPLRDRAKFDWLIDSFVNLRINGPDPGMKGVTRVGRLPESTNGKPKHNDWAVRVARWTGKRFNPAMLAEHFGFKLTVPPPKARVTPPDVRERAEQWKRMMEFLRTHQMLRSHEENKSGWIDVVCPWTHEHTGQANNGASVATPNEENGWVGGFRCHHGHCAHRTWRDLSDWAVELMAEELEATDAPETLEEFLHGGRPHR